MRVALAVVVPFALAFAPAPVPRQADDLLAERFAAAAPDVSKGYGKFDYRATAANFKGEVRAGRLVLRGDHGEGDQRLSVTARRLTGRDALPDALDVAVKLGGTAEENFCWHVGVAVGGVKVLIHPEVEGGAFRAETADAQTHLFPNETMPFTPAASVLHEMTLKVRKTPKGYRFDVTVEDGGGGGTHRKTFDVTAEQMGRYDSVALVRSGRRGGAALFGAVTVRRGR